MKGTYDSEADVLCLVLRDDPLLHAVEESNEVRESWRRRGARER
jgi:uncharacterized protein YuzE